MTAAHGAGSNILSHLPPAEVGRATGGSVIIGENKQHSAAAVSAIVFAFPLDDVA
jgi:hypothetical protein